MSKIAEQYFMQFLDTNTWRPIYLNGKLSSYLVSRNGEIYNKTTGVTLKQSFTKDGYCVCGLSMDGAHFTLRVHRLVAEAFIPNPDQKPEVNHIDGVKTHNNVENLEWVTSKENTAHAIKMGLKWFFGEKGEANANNRYTEEQIRQACKMMENPMNRPIVISQMTGVSRITLQRIRTGKMWNDIAKEYTFPPVNFIDGENNCNNKYTEEQVHEVCRLIEENKLKFVDIAARTGVSKDTVHSIWTKRVWRQISEFYEFPDINRGHGENHGNSVYSAAQIHQVCTLLENPDLSYNEIAKLTGTTMNTVSQVRKGRIWKEISKDYNIVDRRNRKTELILDLYHQGYTNSEITTIIMEEFGATDRRHINLQVNDVKKRYLSKLSGSTTIDQLWCT